MNHFEAAAEKIEKLRIGLLLDEDGDAAESTLSPMAEQHFLLALAALEQAQRYMKLVEYCNMRSF